MLVLTLTMCELCHWPSIASMSPQSHCDDEEMDALDCLLSTLCIMIQFLLIFIYICIYGIQNKKQTSFNVWTTVFFKNLPCHHDPWCHKKSDVSTDKFQVD